MTTTENFLESRILLSLSPFRERTQSPQLDGLRKRIVGELIGDADAVAETLDPAFELVMHSGDRTFTLTGGAIVDGIRATAAAGVLMWLELDDLVIDGETIAGYGAMLTLQTTQRTLGTAPLGLFLRLREGRMISEAVFVGGATETEVAEDAMPSVAALRAQINS